MQLLTVAQAAEALNIKVATVRAWLVQGKLPRVSCGRAVRIPAAAIREFIERNTVPAREAEPEENLGRSGRPRLRSAAGAQ